MHVVAQGEGLVDHLHFAQHLFTALGPLDGFFAVELFEFGDDLLLVPDLGLVVEPGALLLIAEGLLFFGIHGVIAGKESGGSIFDLDDLGDSPVKEISVMGHDKYGAPIVGQIVFQPADTAQIKMVGRLVEHDHIRALQQKARQGDAGLLAAGEGRDLFVELAVLKAQAAEDTGDLSFIGIAVQHLEAVQEIGVGLDELVEGIALDGLHFLLIL